MTSETTTTPRGSGGHRADGSGYGLVVFAAILLFVLGFFNMLYGAAAIANSHVFVANAHFEVGNLRFGLDHAHHRRLAAGRRGRDPVRQPAGPLVRRGPARA